MMKKKINTFDKLLLMISFISAIAFIFTTSQSCSYANKKIGQKDDWIAEEITEEIIKSQTGLSIDLTPETKEK